LSGVTAVANEATEWTLWELFAFLMNF
jgi:hypothetical protein